MSHPTATPEKTGTPEKAVFSMAEARKIVGDLFQPKPWIYWTDFLVSMLTGYACAALTRSIAERTDWPLGTRLMLLAAPFLASCLLFYRGVMFIHELTHLRAGTMRGFRFVWNLLCGIPFLIPSFIYYPHIDHHRRKHFGTQRDGEYLPLGSQPPWGIVLFMLQGLYVPPLALVRFLILTPLTWVIPGFRRFIHQRASSMVIDPTYIRPLPAKRTLRIMRMQEALCFLFLASLFIAAPLKGMILPWKFIIQGYCTAFVIITLNAARTLGAHRWHNDGSEMTFVGQLLDSVNYPSRAWITELWGPVGTRLHAIHHLFPSLPYHNLPEAHRRLMRDLPADSPYRETNCTSLTAALLDLWRRSATSNRAKTAAEPVDTAA